MNKLGFVFECRKCQTEFWLEVNKLKADPVGALKDLVKACPACGEEESRTVRGFSARGSWMIETTKENDNESQNDSNNR